jgi:hypothetical protein
MAKNPESTVSTEHRMAELQSAMREMEQRLLLALAELSKAVAALRVRYPTWGG